ncbi:DUF6207 family protein [Streptomyces sp. NPDC088180]|uniref:DUF6207 family protein n=1 Tax=Streptomyces sp. NPDC088180 TaxID=3365837 RepID=UPI00382A8767
MTASADARHVSEPGLVVLHITAADEETAPALMDELQQIWATSGITEIRRDPAQPGVHARVHADIRRTDPGGEVRLPQGGEDRQRRPTSDRVKELFPKDVRHLATAGRPGRCSVDAELVRAPFSRRPGGPTTSAGPRHRAGLADAGPQHGARPHRIAPPSCRVPTGAALTASSAVARTQWSVATPGGSHRAALAPVPPLAPPGVGYAARS